MNQVIIDKIQLTIAGKVIDLTVEQAKDLQKVLNDLWPETTITISPQPYRDAPNYPVVPWPSTPVYPTTDPYPLWTQSQVTWCEGTGNMLCISTK